MKNKYPEWAIKKAESNGISYAVVNNRVGNCGWALERAITEPLHMNKSYKKHWTKEEEKYLEQAFEVDKKTSNEIAENLNRSIYSVRGKIANMGLFKYEI